MTKHLIGFGLFVSIVGFFVIAYAVLTLPPMPSLKPEISPLAKLPTHCDFGPSEGTRAIADRWSGTVTIYLNELPKGSGVDSSELNTRFTFYAVRGDKVRLTDVVTDSLVRTVQNNAGTKWTLRYSAPWVKGLSSGDNLYVIAGVGSEREAFSIASAIPVLVKN